MAGDIILPKGPNEPLNSSIPQELIDAAQRMREAVNMHILFNNEMGRTSPGFVVINLEDGRSPDGVLYDNRADATRHHRNNTHICFVQVPRSTMPLNEAIIVLQTFRKARLGGVMFTEEQVIVPQLPELLNGYIPNTLKRLKK
jgi:hypothetical protein